MEVKKPCSVNVVSSCTTRWSPCSSAQNPPNQVNCPTQYDREKEMAFFYILTKFKLFLYKCAIHGGIINFRFRSSAVWGCLGFSGTEMNSIIAD
jgi:hypothetical protein